MVLLVPDDLWLMIEPLLPPERAKPKGGRPRAPDRAALAGILFVLRTGIQWREVPAELGCCGETCWRRLAGWHAAGVWAGLHRTLLERLNDARQLNWSRAALDSVSIGVQNWLIRSLGAGRRSRGCAWAHSVNLSEFMLSRVQAPSAPRACRPPGRAGASHP